MSCRICGNILEEEKWPVAGVCDSCYSTMTPCPNPKLRIKLVREFAIKPSYATDGSGGIDLHSCEDKPVYVHFGDPPIPVNTGVTVEIPAGYVGLIKGRSGMAFHGGIFGFDGVIDSDYRGEIRVLLRNYGRLSQCYRQGQRIAQLVIVPCPRFSLVEVCCVTNTVRGDGGFGSTGK